MSAKQSVKLLHFIASMWFVLCIAYLLVRALLDAGLSWWVIFSLSGHSATAIFVVFLIYLFAIYRGTIRSEEPDVEHPLTSSLMYIGFYSVAPLLGGIAGLLGGISTVTAHQYATVISWGTLVVTFVVWIIIDPIISVIEAMQPVARQRRAHRIAQARAERKIKEQERQRWLDELETQEIATIAEREKKLRPWAERLAALIEQSQQRSLSSNELLEAVDMGLAAWQIGGAEAMQQLHKMTFERTQATAESADTLSVWWDGIGQWRAVSEVPRPVTQRQVTPT